MAKNDSNTPESSAQILSLPDGPDGSDGLTARQRLIMEMITATTAERGYPPSVREIADAVGLASPSSVQHQLGVLQKKGFINRDATRARALDVLSQDVVGIPEHLLEGDLNPETAYVPLVGRIAAGGPILAEQSVEEIFPLPKSLVGEGELFMLKVSGDSMIDAAI
jgi:repressor LexA